MDKTYLRVNVFCDQRWGGNPLAVFADSADLPADTMQRIAHEMMLPETSFIVPSELPECLFRLRIFTPLTELPMAGHPTVGTAFALAELGLIHSGMKSCQLELGVGPVALSLEWDAQRLKQAWMTQPTPEFGQQCIDRAQVAACLGLQPHDLADEALPAQIVSSGVALLFIPLANRAAVDRAQLDRERAKALYGALGESERPVYVFTLEPGDDDALTYSRMFAPIFGIDEDPATGGACGPLGAYLTRYAGARNKGGREVMINIQGVNMGRPSRILIKPDSDPHGPVAVGGRANIVGSGTLKLA